MHRQDARDTVAWKARAPVTIGSSVARLGIISMHCEHTGSQASSGEGVCAQEVLCFAHRLVLQTTTGGYILCAEAILEAHLPENKIQVARSCAAAKRVC